jgi:uncharacterized protein YegJ (DUF2314 family)
MIIEDKDGQKIVYSKPSQSMEDAYTQAQQTFNYFWRELYWENRRIVKALYLTIVKVAFEQQFGAEDEPIVEHMWMGDIYFDGEKITGILMNSPNQLTNVSEGDQVSVALAEINDWMYVIKGITYGGFTIQLLRSQMSEEERQQHDDAWGLNFGDHKNIKIVYEQEEHPENLIEHPMSINMADQVRDYITENPDCLTSVDENGLTMLHHEAIAGNKTIVDILLEKGVDKNVKSNKGKTALDYAKELHWEYLIPVL